MTPADLRTFAFAGKAVFTAVSGRDGSHVTLRITKAKDRARAQGWPVEAPYFLSVRTNRDNAEGWSNAWAYLGIVNRAGVVTVTGRSRSQERPEYARALQVAVWLFRVAFEDGKLPTGYAIKHEGLCGRCARKLTDPASIDRGIGPECAGLMQRAA